MLTTHQFGNLMLTTWDLNSEMSEYHRLRALCASNGWLIHNAKEVDRNAIRIEIQKLILKGTKGFRIDSPLKSTAIRIAYGPQFIERW